MSVEEAGGRYRVKCSFCGATFYVPKHVKYATCPYCGTTIVLETKKSLEEEKQHFLFKTYVSGNKAYETALGFAEAQWGAPRRLREESSLTGMRIHYIPLYIYEINITADCRGVKKTIMPLIFVERYLPYTVKKAGEEVAYVSAPAVAPLPIPVPPDYGFPARGREYFKPSKLKQGRYYQPTLDPGRVLERLRRRYREKVVEEAREACGGEAEVRDESRLVGLAHYPFWEIRYVYGGETYRAIVDGADGTVVYLEYPITAKSRIMGVLGSGGMMLGSFILGAGVSLIGGAHPLLGGAAAAAASIPGAYILMTRSGSGRGTYRFRPSEEGVFAGIR